MADKVSAGTGNWNTAGTWTPSGAPSTGQTVDILSGHTVTLDVDANPGTLTIGVDNGAETMGALVVGDDITLTAGGDITVGTGTGNGGTFTFGAGSTLALGENDLILNNCIVNSTAATDNWAFVTGTGSILNGAALNDGGTPAVGIARNQIELQYVSFQNTGSIWFAAGSSAGGATITSILQFINCVFVGQSTIQFGRGGWTSLATHERFEGCDFLNQTGDAPAIYFTGATGTPTGDNYISNCTFSNTSFNSLRLGGRDEYTFTNCILNNVAPRSSNSTSGSTTLSGCIVYGPSDAGTALNWIVVTDDDAVPGWVLEGNFFYFEDNNNHFIGRGGTGNTYGVTVQDNIFEVILNTDGANLIGAGTGPTTVQRNILINSGVLADCIGNKTGGTYTVKNNTVYWKESAATNQSYGSLWLSENGKYTGTLNIANNLVTGSVTVDKGCYRNSATPADWQTITYSDYNVWDGVTYNYRYCTVTAGTTHDRDDVDPDFVDPTRCLSTYSTLKGGEGTAADAIVQLLLKNGYDSDTDTQVEADVSPYSAAELVAWVRAGFAPRNQALKGTGDPLDGSPDIGAVPVLTEEEEPPPGPQPEPEISVTFEGYVTIPIDWRQVWKKIFDPTTSRLRFTAQLRG